VPGRGVTARVAGRLVEIGSPAHLLGAAPDPAGAAVADMEQSGQTAAVVRVDGHPVALFGIADRTRPPPRPLWPASPR
jgi:cation-transporting P-type ATPase J